MDIPQRPIALTQLSVMQSASIVSLPADYPVFRRLAAYGILPGVKIKLERRFPAFIIVVGATRIALDQQMAGGIMVQLANR